MNFKSLVRLNSSKVNDIDYKLCNFFSCKSSFTVPLETDALYTALHYVQVLLQHYLWVLAGRKVNKLIGFEGSMYVIEKTLAFVLPFKTIPCSFFPEVLRFYSSISSMPSWIQATSIVEVKRFVKLYLMSYLMSVINATLGKCWSGGGKECEHLGLKAGAGHSLLWRELSASHKTTEAPNSPV